MAIFIEDSQSDTRLPELQRDIAVHLDVFGFLDHTHPAAELR
jgi:hypothetical protein